MGGWSDKTKLILISTEIEVVVEVKLDLGNDTYGPSHLIMVFSHHGFLFLYRPSPLKLGIKHSLVARGLN